jgi:hypothetical protein
LTPFQVSPNVDIELVSQAGEVVTGTSVVQVAHKDLELVLHIPERAPQGTYTVRAVLYHLESSNGDAMDTSVDLGQGTGDA